MSVLRRRLMAMQWDNTPIEFEDPEVKRICVENFGGLNGIANRIYGDMGVKGVDGEVTYRQARAVTHFHNIFKGNTAIATFNELEHFQNLRTIDRLFNGCSGLTEITLPRANKLDGKANEVFRGCKKLTRVNNLNAIRRLEYLAYMFYECESLEHVDFTGIDMSGIMGITFAFSFCTSLKSVNFGNTDFSKVDNLYYIFCKCENLEQLINFNSGTFGVSVTPHVRRYHNGGLFHTCTKLVMSEDFVMDRISKLTVLGGDCFISLPLKYFDFRNWSNLQGISFATFSNCVNFEGATLPGNTPFTIDGCFYDYGVSKSRFLSYHLRYIRFLSETPPEIRNNYPNDMPLNWYVPSNAIQAYRDYADSLEYLTVKDKIVIKPLGDWFDDCDKFGWTKYEDGGTVYTLPDDYEQLEYLENTSDAFIDTGVIPDHATEIKMDAQLVTRNANPRNGNFPFGARETFLKNAYEYMWVANNDIHSYWTVNNMVQIISKGFDYNRHELKILANGAFFCFFDGRLERAFNKSDFKCKTTLYLFGCNSLQADGYDSSFKGRIFSTKIWHENQIVRNFVPARHKATGRFGMFDLVGRQFYTSPNNVDFMGG